jgi:hypothetical protein
MNWVLIKFVQNFLLQKDFLNNSITNTSLFWVQHEWRAYLFKIPPRLEDVNFSPSKVGDSMESKGWTILDLPCGPLIMHGIDSLSYILGALYQIWRSKRDYGTSKINVLHSLCVAWTVFSRGSCLVESIVRGVFETT